MLAAPVFVTLLDVRIPRLMIPVISAALILQFPIPSIAAPFSAAAKWQTSSTGAGSTWNLTLGKVTWSNNFRAPILALDMTEKQGKLKFDKKRKNGFTFWFTNLNSYSGNPESLVFPAVVLDGDPTSTGSTPNLIYEERVVIGRASTIEAGSACSLGSRTAFTCKVNAIFSQDGGTITNYLGEGVRVHVNYFTENGDDLESNVLVFDIPHKNFPASELAKKYANSFRSSGTTTEKTYTNKLGASCKTLNQVSPSETFNLVCKRVEGRNIWVEDESNAASNKQSSKQSKAKRPCVSSQLTNLGNFYTRIEQAELKIQKLSEAQQGLRDQIAEFRRRGVSFNEPTYRAKIATNQAEIINQQNVISKNIKGFESIDGVCSQKKYVLSSNRIDDVDSYSEDMDAVDELEVE